jgi:hypothetical protein
MKIAIFLWRRLENLFLFQITTFRCWRVAKQGIKKYSPKEVIFYKKKKMMILTNVAQFHNATYLSGKMYKIMCHHNELTE